MKPHYSFFVRHLRTCLSFAFAFLLCAWASPARDDTPADTNSPDDAAVSDAICPIVYPVDEAPSDQGYQYIFYGNGFFINKDGYLVTAAHVLSTFRNGDAGQPYILLNRPHAPAVLQKVTVIAADWKHDVAVLRATPNPFERNFKVAYLSLTPKALAPGNLIQAVALRPFKVQDAHTFQPPHHERFTGRVVDFEFTQEEKGAGDTELLLFDHEVQRGQSGAPVISPDTHEVVGIVDGRWLRPNVGIALRIAPQASSSTPTPASSSAASSGSKPKSAPTPQPTSTSSSTLSAAPTPAATKPVAPPVGAAVRIHYAIALLQRNGIRWQPVQEPSRGPSQEPSQEPSSNPPVPVKEEGEGQASVPSPISVVAAPYPAQALFGGEVVLDALVSSDGTLSDVQLVHGDAPFRTKAQDAVQSWSFRPARVEGRPVDDRIAVVFDFTEPFLPSPKSGAHTYPEPSDSDDRAPLPVYTVEPPYPVDSVDEGSVVVLGKIDARGELTSMQIIRGAGPLATATTAAMQQWRFVPGKRDGEAVESAVVVVATFRRPALTRLNSSHELSTQLSAR